MERASAIPPSVLPPPRYNVLGVGVSALTRSHAAECVAAARYGEPRGYVCVCTVHGVSEARDDASFRAILNHSHLTTPDGMPLVWLAPPGVERVYGPDLMLDVCDAGRATSLRHYLFGGTPGVASQLAERLCGRFQGLQIVGTFTPPFRPLNPAETDTLIADVKRTRPDIIWVGLSTPKQERFMAEFAPRLRAGLLVGVGAAFDFHAGRVRQAPRWMMRSGLEWLFRFAMEPRRLGPRYLKTIPLFVARVAARRVGWKRYAID